MSDIDPSEPEDDIHAIDLLWQKVIERVPDLRTRLSLKHASLICAEEPAIFVIFASKFHHAAVGTEGGKSMIEQAISEVFGSSYKLECLLVSSEDWQRLHGHFYASRRDFMAVLPRP